MNILCAGRTGQILNLLSIANECGISHNTAKSWLSVLEASYIITLIKPHYKNFNKRLVKSPKLYFLDVGLAVYLLDIFKPKYLESYPLRGALFETFIVSEILKNRFNKIKPKNLYYFRDNVGNEIDLLLDFGTKVIPIEIKSGKTVTSDYLKNLKYYYNLNTEQVKEMFLIYAGELVYKDKNCYIENYSSLDRLYRLLKLE